MDAKQVIFQIIIIVDYVKALLQVAKLVLIRQIASNVKLLLNILELTFIAQIAIILVKLVDSFMIHA